MRTRRVAVAVGVTVAALGLTATAGCSARPGAAAVVDGHEISEAYLDDTYEDFADLGTATPEQLLNVLVALRAGEAVAVEHDISVSGADALAALEEGGVDTSDFSPGGVQIARYLAMVGEAQAAADVDLINQEMDAARRAADIDVNPRYGVLDVETGTIVAEVRDWIVTADVTEAVVE